MKTKSSVRGRILVVEDDEDMRENLRRLLGGAGYDVCLAPSGIEAMALLCGQPYDLVLTDLVMPDMGGLELLTEIRHQHQHLPVVFLTAFGDRSTFDKVMEMGAVDFLTKPFRAEVLLGLLGQILRDRSDDDRHRHR
jgi:DNA-binding response OmpR family regulator